MNLILFMDPTVVRLPPSQRAIFAFTVFFKSWDANKSVNCGLTNNLTPSTRSQWENLVGQCCVLHVNRFLVSHCNLLSTQPTVVSLTTAYSSTHLICVQMFFMPATNENLFFPFHPICDIYILSLLISIHKSFFSCSACKEH